MNRNRIKLTLSFVILAQIVCCLSFGQTAGSRSGIKSETLQDLEQKYLSNLNTNLPTIIDFKKIDLSSGLSPKLKTEIRQGPGSGGGGNSCALMIKENTRMLIDKLSIYSPLQEEKSSLVQLLRNIKSAKFVLGSDLMVDGKKVEAINYPEAKTIVIEQSFCDQMNSISLRSMGILLHEYLGLTLIDDTGFEVSGDLILKLNASTPRENLRVNSAASLDQCPQVNGQYAVISASDKIFKTNKENEHMGYILKFKTGLMSSGQKIDFNRKNASFAFGSLSLQLTGDEIFLDFDAKAANYFVKYKAGCISSAIVIEVEGVDNNGRLERVDTYKEHAIIQFISESQISISIDKEIYSLKGEMLVKKRQNFDLERQP